MPSPVLHTLAAVLIAKPALARRSAQREGGSTQRTDAILIGSAVIAANVPDLDFVPGILMGDPGKYHHGASHSLIAAIMFGVAACLIARFARYPSAARLGLIAGLAYVSHLLLDAAAPLDDAGRGVPFLWPYSGEHFVSPVRLFMGIGLEPSRGGLLASLLTPHNILALGLEVAVVVAVVGAVRVLRK